VNNLLLNGLDPKSELDRHIRLANEYRAKLDAIGKKRNWRYRDILSSLVFHQEETEKIRENIRTIT
jgi:hypothetical protein